MISPKGRQEEGKARRQKRRSLNDVGKPCIFRQVESSGPVAASRRPGAVGTDFAGQDVGFLSRGDRESLLPKFFSDVSRRISVQERIEGPI